VKVTPGNILFSVDVIIKELDSKEHLSISNKIVTLKTVLGFYEACQTQEMLLNVLEKTLD